MTTYYFAVCRAYQTADGFRYDVCVVTATSGGDVLDDLRNDNYYDPKIIAIYVFESRGEAEAFTDRMNKVFWTAAF